MTTRSRTLVAAFVAALLVPLAGCGTIMNGSTQDVNIASTPRGAVILVNGMQNAQTPAVVALDRKSSQTIELDLDGYEPYVMQFRRSTSGWVWGNILFGGLIGLAVDASTGGMYKLSPEQVAIQLEEAGGAATAEVKDDGLYIFVTLEAEDDWQPVGLLEEEE